MEPERSKWFAAGLVVVMTLIIYLIQSVYLHLINKAVTGAEIGFGQWFSFSTWTAFVGVFGALAAFLTIFMAESNQLAPQSLQALSMNSLFIHASPGDPWYTWGTSLALINFWTLFLMSIGFARWTGASMVQSTIVACTPWVLIFGIWALMI